MKAVKLNPMVNNMLDEISAKRKKNYEQVAAKSAIIAELIERQYKREIQK